MTQLLKTGEKAHMAAGGCEALRKLCRSVPCCLPLRGNGPSISKSPTVALRSGGPYRTAEAVLPRVRVGGGLR